LYEDYEHGETSTTILSGSQSQENIQQISAESDSDSEFTFLSRKRSRRYTNRQVPANLDNIFEQMNLAEHLTEEDEGATDTDTSTGEPDEPDDENLDNFEDYSSPDYEPLRDPPASESTSGRFLWILLWIMNFWTRFNLPETGTESLIKFIKLLLAEISSSEFDKFPNSLYMAQKELSMQDNFLRYVQNVTNFIRSKK
jgi:hypothetical protein